jgi:hypothetical protein
LPHGQLTIPFCPGTQPIEPGSHVVVKPKAKEAVQSQSQLWAFGTNAPRNIDGVKKPSFGAWLTLDEGVVRRARVEADHGHHQLAALDHLGTARQRLDRGAGRHHVVVQRVEDVAQVRLV